MVVITGATGLLGRHLVEKFHNESVQVTALYRSETEPGFQEGILKRKADILDQVSLIEAFEGATTVIHAAALVSFNPKKRKRILEANVEGTRNVTDICLQLGIKNLIHVSSVSALGRKSGELLTEQSSWNGMHASDYAVSKYLAELEVFRGAEEGLTVSIINPSVILSASQPLRSSAALFDYVWNERSFYTDGALNYVDARDVADVVFKLYKHPKPGQKFILSAGSVLYKEFFSMVAAHFGKAEPSVKISHTLSWWVGWTQEVLAYFSNHEPLVTRQSASMAIQSFRYDNSKVQAEMNMQFRSLEDTLTWCCSQYLLNVKANK